MMDLSNISSLFRTLLPNLARRIPKFSIKHLCLTCAESSDERICTACESYWSLQSHYCQQCSLPTQQHTLICGECLRYPPKFDQSYAPYCYDAPLSQLILTFKNKGDLALGAALCDYWQQRLKQRLYATHLTKPDLLAPVPSHWRRQWQQGFSHTHFCASQLSRHLGIPVLSKSTAKAHQSSQKALTRQQRLRKLSSTFSVTTPLNGEHVAIIDDVMTTGATANAFTEKLKAAGAGTVTVWVLARTPKH